ncbi:hypothetical protein IWX48DRAFT_592291 [Phyllosticta citricarpa]
MHAWFDAPPPPLPGPGRGQGRAEAEAEAEAEAPTLCSLHHNARADAMQPSGTEEWMPGGDRIESRCARRLSHFPVPGFPSLFPLLRQPPSLIRPGTNSVQLGTCVGVWTAAAPGSWVSSRLTLDQDIQEGQELASQRSYTTVPHVDRRKHHSKPRQPSPARKSKACKSKSVASKGSEKIPNAAFLTPWLRAMCIGHSDWEGGVRRKWSVYAAAAAAAAAAATWMGQEKRREKRKKLKAAMSEKVSN